MKKIIFSIYFIFIFNISNSETKTLLISPVFQITPVWCWVTCGEMVFKYYDIPNVNPAGIYQCGIIGVYFGPNTSCWYNCMSCIVPAGNSMAITRMLNYYPSVVKFLLPSKTIRQLSHDYDNDKLSFDEVVSQIDDHKPIIAGISPSGYRNASGVSEHVAVIIGYDIKNEVEYLIVNDPFPYSNNLYFSNDPYIRARATKLMDGRYKISYDTFVENLLWRETFYNIY